MIFNLYTGGGGQTGATLHVESVDAGTVTVSSEAVGRSYSKDVNANSTVDFPGLATGVWTVTLSREGMQPATRTVSITSDYGVTIAYFTATINVSYPAGSRCSIQSASMFFEAPDDSGVWPFAAPLPGLWVIYCTDGERTTRREVNITAAGQIIDVPVYYDLLFCTDGVPDGNFSISVVPSGPQAFRGMAEPLASSFTGSEMSISFANNNRYGCWIVSEESYALAEFKTINVSSYFSECAPNENYVVVGVLSDDLSEVIAYAELNRQGNTGATEAVVTLDLTDITSGTGRFAVGGCAYFWNAKIVFNTWEVLK